MITSSKVDPRPGTGSHRAGRSVRAAIRWCHAKDPRPHCSNRSEFQQAANLGNSPSGLLNRSSCRGGRAARSASAPTKMSKTTPCTVGTVRFLRLGCCLWGDRLRLVLRQASWLARTMISTRNPTTFASHVEAVSDCQSCFEYAQTPPFEGQPCFEVARRWPCKLQFPFRPGGFSPRLHHTTLTTHLGVVRPVETPGQVRPLLPPARQPLPCIWLTQLCIRLRSSARPPEDAE
jgi:hypothetical protein